MIDFNDTVQAFLNSAAEILGDEGRALAENIGRNLTESVRQPRNALEAGIDARKSKPELMDASNLDLAAGNERNVKASFETHLKAMERRVADEAGRVLKAEVFVKIDGGKGALQTAEEYSASNAANLGPHPHSNAISVPVPKGYEDIADAAAKIYGQPDEAQQIADMLIAMANKK